MFSKQRDVSKLERKRELSEYRFYFAILMPVCIVSSIFSRLTSPLAAKAKFVPDAKKSVWSEAVARANTITPFIMMRY